MADQLVAPYSSSLTFSNQSVVRPVQIAWTLALGCATLAWSRRVSDGMGCLLWLGAVPLWLASLGPVGQAVTGDPLVPGLLLVGALLGLWMLGGRPSLHLVEVVALVALSLAMAYGYGKPLSQTEWAAAAAFPVGACGVACFLASRGLQPDILPSAWLALVILLVTTLWSPLLVASFFLFCLLCLGRPGAPRWVGLVLTLLGATVAWYAPFLPLAVLAGLLAMALQCSLALLSQGRLSPLFLLPAAACAAVVAGRPEALLTAGLALLLGVLLAAGHRAIEARWQSAESCPPRPGP